MVLPARSVRGMVAVDGLGFHVWYEAGHVLTPLRTCILRVPHPGRPLVGGNLVLLPPLVLSAPSPVSGGDSVLPALLPLLRVTQCYLTPHPQV